MRENQGYDCDQADSRHIHGQGRSFRQFEYINVTQQLVGIPYSAADVFYDAFGGERYEVLCLLLTETAITQLPGPGSVIRRDLIFKSFHRVMGIAYLFEPEGLCIRR